MDEGAEQVLPVFVDDVRLLKYGVHDHLLVRLLLLRPEEGLLEVVEEGRHVRKVMRRHHVVSLLLHHEVGRTRVQTRHLPAHVIPVQHVPNVVRRHTRRHRGNLG